MNALHAYLEAHLRPWPYADATPEEIARPNRSELAAALGIDPRSLNHKMRSLRDETGGSNWTEKEIRAAGRYLGEAEACYAEEVRELDAYLEAHGARDAPVMDKDESVKVGAHLGEREALAAFMATAPRVGHRAGERRRKALEIEL
jgi:hypothetical protein